MKRQTDLQLIGYINKYGCFFMCMVYWLLFKINKKEPTYSFLNMAWDSAIDRNIISGDVNKDGDMDDADELLILDKDALLKLVDLKIRYLGTFPPGSVVHKEGQHYIGEFYNARTKFTHFAAIDKGGKVEYDPIKDSMTVREGVLKSVRVFG